MGGAHLVAIWLYWRQTPQQQEKHMQEDTQIKIMILRLSNNFSTKNPVIQAIDLSPLGWRSNHSVFTSVLMRFNKNDTLANSSGMNVQHSVWIMA